MTDYFCTLCPRGCNAARTESEGVGVCASGTLPRVARAAPHYWEEPCVSGKNGSGAVFFSGCALRCSYCQNGKISLGGHGKTVTVARLREIYFELIARGAHNINLVNPTHFAEAILQSLDAPLPVPVICNTGGYDKPETLRRFEGKIQIYIPDMKYALSAPAEKYSAAPDYPEIACAAILEMFRQTGRFALDGDGLLRSGVIIRHLILPGHLENTFRVIDWVSGAFAPGDVLFSLMSQYTPRGEPSRAVSQREYGAVMNYLGKSNIGDGFFQDMPDGEEAYIPDFDLTGV
ncbi:MAG: radical SAM protein [Oscillospiraceae bacterium]|nr:radical SAM protein [Oscillospiraceae bacterium]